MSRANVFRSGILLAAGAAVALWPNACGRPSSSTALPNGSDLRTEIVATGFDTIWELAWGPDGAIWVTERPGRISRVNPSTGETTRVGDVAVSESGEGGLMGLAFHPDFATEPWVYVAHTYEAGNETRNRVVRMRFDGSTLGPPQVIVDGIPGASNHNGSRVVVGPDRLLYVTTGDATDATLSQDKSSLAGKILRLTLDGAPAPGNPFGSRIFTYGHRNPQGLVFAPDGTLFETEHGPNDNDEVNRIEAGRNYGWPGVHGRCDGDIAGETAFCQSHDVAEPLAQWTPTIAPSGLDYYNATRIPSWRGSLLFTTLKGAALYRLTLSADGRSVTAQEKLFGDTFGRLRDVMVAPDGAVYIGTSNKDGRGSILSDDDKIVRVVPK